MNHVVKRTRQTQPISGFTLIELMLSMTFLAILLLAIAMTIIQIGTIYNKGIVVKEINQIGRLIGDDVKRTSAAAASINLTTDYVPSTAGGRFCLGEFSYIWNTTVAIENNDPNLTTYEGSSIVARPLHFVKLPDSPKDYCKKEVSTGGLLFEEIRAADISETQELIPSGDHSLGINKFSIPVTTFVTDDTIQQSVYTLNYTIGSGLTRTMTTDQSACLGPGQANADLEYCAVEQFSIVLRTGSRT